jgi:hypothetical protein
MRNQLACLLAILMLSACQTTPGRPSGPVPTYEQLAATHNARVEQLSRIYSRGVVELAWRDENGARRSQQGDVDLYLSLPRHTALRIGKLAETFLWLGSDDERYWLFDLQGERSLFIGRHDAPNDDAISTVPPLVMLDLIGLGRITTHGDANEMEARFDAEHKAWVIVAWGGGGLLRVYFDPATRLPKRVESITHDGVPIYFSTIHMNRYQSVPVPGISTAAQPRMATLIDIFSTDRAPADGHVKLALDGPTGRVDDLPFNRVFDLERLKLAHRPQRVEGDQP